MGFNRDQNNRKYSENTQDGFVIIQSYLGRLGTLDCDGVGVATSPTATKPEGDVAADPEAGAGAALLPASTGSRSGGWIRGPGCIHINWRDAAPAAHTAVG